MNTKNKILIYGSYGYTGSLIVNRCLAEGLKPVLGGRNLEKLSAQSEALGLEYQLIDLLNITTTPLDEYLAVINCAGPFCYTYKPLIEACLKAKTHYVDITGEYAVFEALMGYDEAAKTAGIMVLPGAGFDVVPSDCLAKYLKQRLPDAQELTLAISTFSDQSKKAPSFSRGTAKTMLQGIATGTMIRDNGKLIKARDPWITKSFPINPEKPKFCTLISWGDIATAWWSTKIPHIETYMALPKQVVQLNKILSHFKWIFKLSPIQRFFENKINQLPEGPSQEERQQSSGRIYGEVKNAAGVTAKALLHTPNGYELTAISSVLILQKIIKGKSPSGFQTPSTAYSADFVLETPGVERFDLD